MRMYKETKRNRIASLIAAPNFSFAEIEPNNSIPNNVGIENQVSMC